MNLSDETLEQIKLHYTEEYQKTLRKLKELEGILNELSGVSIAVPNVDTISKNTTSDVEKESAITNETNAEPKRSYKKRAKKRGRKSIWGSFVLKRLKAVHRPLNYDELANHAIVQFKLTNNEFDQTRKSIISTVFNLRNKQDKVKTLAKKGTRDKYVFLNSWIDDKGKPLPEFKEYVK